LKILCTNWEAADEGILEREHFPDVELIIQKTPADPTGFLSPELCRSVDAVVNYSPTRPLGMPPSAFENVKVAVRSGVGFDNLDTEGFGRIGVPVCNVPDYGTTEVADHALALMLALLRGTASYDETLRSKENGWDFGAAPLIRRLRDATFGIVGLGRIGLAAARRAAGFDMKIVFYDPYLSNGVELSTGYARVHSLAELFAVSDVVSIHAPLNEETRGLIGAKVFDHAKKGLVLVNTARGPIVDLDALAVALKDGRVAGAGLDVLPKEPADPGHPLVAAWRAREGWLDGRLVLTPHAAFYSPASMIDLRLKSVGVAVDYLRDGRLTNCVNREFLPAKLRSAA
jgi:D-3-phosphoglycerate dehydrogenase/C-terminal binding protein